ncbi:hypothetical protein HYFRA_00003010 [Hymenoscyphus fraxineus]|uniref:Uncharacterized protein n=1 Tax=Hymenoscyphus fraxineus TaxID=746836 RepID=A0A9N9PFS5_9HELO|nr:hypothetical protein HYFRA_00003010 [Hymenoscyphus fraxineus]
MAPQQLIPSSNGIWTTESSKRFYKAVQLLDRKLGGRDGGKSPVHPADYRADVGNTSDSSDYTLSYSEELDLADDFAFLAAVKGDDPEYVSATVVEEQRDAPGLIIRLASNKTPKEKVVESLRGFIGMIQDHARSDERMLFDEIIGFSQERIHSRMRSAHWKQPGRFGKKSKRKPLYAQVEQKLTSIWNPVLRRGEEELELKRDLRQLSTTLKEFDSSPENRRVSKLKEILLQCHSISHGAAFNSLEKRFRHFGLSEKESQSSVIRQIDKLGKYWQICLNLVRHSRRRRTRGLFKNFKLEPILAPPAGQPYGSNERCFVHGEVQLVLHYEMNMVESPPRAIGSSKSACFLCDRFVSLHGKFRISHSHMKFYSQWMVTDSEWMGSEQRKVFRAIMGNMTNEMMKLAKNGMYVENCWAESKANVWQVRAQSSLASSVISVIIEEAAPLTPPIGLERKSSSSSSSTIRASNQYGEDTRTEVIPNAETIIPSRNSPIQKSVHVINQIEEVKPEFEPPNTTPRIATPPQTCKPLSPSTLCQQHEGPPEPGLEEMNQSLAVSTATAAAQDLCIPSNQNKQDRCYINPEETIQPLLSVTPAVKSPLHDAENVKRDEGKEPSGSSPKEMVFLTSTISPAQDSLTQQPSLANEHVGEEANGTQNSESEETISSRATLARQIQPIPESNLVTNQDKMSSPALNKVPPSQLWQQLNTAKQQQKHNKERRIASQHSTRAIEHSDHPTQDSSRNKMDVEIPKRLQNQNSRTASLLHPFPAEQEIKHEEEKPKRKPSPKEKPHNSISPQHPPQPPSQTLTHTSLPLSLPILPTTTTFTLHLTPLHEPNIEYLFDLTTISYGTIEISACEATETRRCVYVNQMGTEEEVFLRPDGDERVLEYGISFGRECMSVRAVITWSDGEEGV